jgi:hypothetical protein
MPRTYDASDLRRARVGVLLLSLIVAGTIAIFFLDALLRATSEGPIITITSESAPGVQPGTDVWVAGRSVGRVTSVQFREPADGRDRIVIRAVLVRGVEDYLRADAVVSLQPGALLEPVVVFIDPGSASEPWHLEQPLAAEDATLGPEVLLELSAALKTAGDTLREQAARVGDVIASGGGTLGALRSDPTVLAEAGARLGEVRTLLRDNHRSGTIGLLAADTLIDARLLRIRDRLAALDSLRTRERATRSLEQTAEALTTFQERLAALSSRIDAGEGTLGRTLQDGELARQVAVLRARLDSTAIEFAKYPERWLKVKVF